MKIRKILLWTLLGLVSLVVIAAVYLYPSYRFFFKKETVSLDKELTIIRGGGGNSGILITDSAVLVIDTKMGSDAEDLYKLAKEKAGEKKIIVINTHYHGDHLRGNKYYAGSVIYIGAYDKPFLDKEVGAENMPNMFVRDSLELNLGNETVVMYNLGRAHTFDDMVVLLRNRKVLFSGDLIFNKVNPVLKRDSGADVDKWIAVLERIILNPDVNRIIPGHGELGGKEMAESLKSYFTDMKAAAADPSKADAIKAKYKDWTEMPMMASPGITIDFIKSGK